jgi:hypothetical protein
MGRASAGATMLASSRFREPASAYRSPLVALAGLGLAVGCADPAPGTTTDASTTGSADAAADAAVPRGSRPSSSASS